MAKKTEKPLTSQKKQKPVKPPKLFLKKYKEKDFQKKIVSRIFNDSDREFIVSSFIKDTDQVYSLKSGISPEEGKQLQAIAKGIKKNTGVVQKGKLIILLVIISAVALFNFLLKDSLLQDALEKGLITIFEAKSKVSDLSFNIFEAKISFSGCAVGDKANPFKNLLELGTTEVDLNMTELLKGKFVVTNIECRDIQFGTVRTESARIESDGASLEEPEPVKEEGESGGFALNLEGVDTDAIIEEELSRLKSPGKIEEINEHIGEMKTKWTDTVAGYEKEIDELGVLIDDVKKIDINKIKTIPAAQNAFKTIDSTAKKAKKLRNAVVNSGEELKKDITSMEEEVGQIRDAITDDYDYLLAFIDAPEQGAKRIFSSVAEDLLKTYCGEFYTYGMRGIDALLNMDFGKKKVGDKKKEKKEKLLPGKGYKIEFPGNTYPNFMIEKALFSIGEEDSSEYMIVRLENISSAPSLTGKPAVASVVFEEDGLKTECFVSVDVRGESEEKFSIAYSIRNYPVELKKGLELLGISAFNAMIHFSTDFKILKENETMGQLFVLLRDISLSQIDPRNEISKNIKEILTGAEEVYVQARYSVKDDGSIDINAESNIDELIAARVGQMIDDLVQDAKDTLKNELDSLLAGALKENETLYAAFKEVESMLDGNVTDSKKLNNFMNKKIKEMEAKIEEIEKQVQDKVEDVIDDYIPEIDLGF